MNNELFVHYWQLPDNLFVSLKPEYHERLCKTIQAKIRDNHKNCFYKILNCPKWHAQRLFNREIRFTLKELEILRDFTEITRDEIEINFESIGNNEDGTIIKNPKLPFQLKDLVYVCAHLMFDGSYRDKRGCYFYAYEPSLVEYHKKRLSAFGEVPINFIDKENQLYFSYTVGYIAKSFLEIETFKSTKCFLSEKLKKLAKGNKILVDEIVKALIVDEGRVDDKIEAELANEKLVNGLYFLIGDYYRLNKVASRTRTIVFKNNPKWTHTTKSSRLVFNASNFKEIYKSISPLPIDYKEEGLKFLFDRQNRKFNQRKMGETKKLIVKSLLSQPKTMEELAKELLVRQTTIRAHLKGHPTYKDSLISLGLVEKIDEKILRRGGYAKVVIYGIKNVMKANELISK